MIKIILAFSSASTLLLLSYAAVFCMNNSQTRRDWTTWTDHLTGPPTSWVKPSNDIQSFYSETQTYRSKNGLTGPLSGYKDVDGNVVIEPRFTACGERFYDGVAWASDPQESRSGYINPDGTWAIVVSGSTHTSFVGGMGEFQVIGEDGYPKFGYVNRKGEEVVPPKYRVATWYVDGFVLVEERTWMGKVTDRLAIEFGAFPGTCFDTKAIILDMEGNVTSLPGR